MRLPAVTLMVTARVQTLDPPVPAALTKEIPQEGVEVGVMVGVSVPVGVQVMLEQLVMPPTPKCW
jgi:hypothetical protein